MMQEDDAALLRFERALSLFVDRLKEDRWIVGAVLSGSLSRETVWRRDDLDLWILEMDGVTRRRRSDGDDKRIFRFFLEEGIDIHAEIIPRSRFKQMVEGTSRTAFTCNFFAKRILLYSADTSIERWFADANTIATRDRDTALCVTATWVIHPLRYIERLLQIKQDTELARQAFIWVAWSLAGIEVIQRGEIYEEEIIYKGIAYNPELFQSVYTDLRDGPASSDKLRAALDRVDRYLDENWEHLLKPVYKALRKKGRMTALSELGDDFAHTQIYPWHLKTACDWLAKKGFAEKSTLPTRLTLKSQVELEEPAYELLD